MPILIRIEYKGKYFERISQKQNVLMIYLNVPQCRIDMDLGDCLVVGENHVVYQ